MTSFNHLLRYASVILVVTSACAIANGANDEQQAAVRAIVNTANCTGGLIVHLGCRDGTLTAALGQKESFIVHGLESNSAKVAQARKLIRGKGLYGRVSIERWSGEGLPYADNLVNLIIVDGESVSAKEIARVLTPRGVALVRGELESRDPKLKTQTADELKGWTKLVKRIPSEIDEWSHYLHSADNNAVAKDSRVGPPRRLQWTGAPKWMTHHDRGGGGMSALVSSKGRLFYIIDEGRRESPMLPAKRMLVARDAFNGVVLWKRKIDNWWSRMFPLKSGPAQQPRRLVAPTSREAGGDKIFVTLGLNAPVSVLDAGSGKTIMEIENSTGTEELIISGGVVFLQVNSALANHKEFLPKFRYIMEEKRRSQGGYGWSRGNAKRRILAVNAESGKLLWQKESDVTPLTLTADAKQVYFHDGQTILCLDRKSGQQVWKSAPIAIARTGSHFAPIMAVHKDVLMFAHTARQQAGFSVKDGSQLWKSKRGSSGCDSPGDLFIIDDKVWSGNIRSGGSVGVFTSRNLHTGEITDSFSPELNPTPYWFHHRCYRAKATEKYFITSRTGTEFIDREKQSWQPHHWVRGGCTYGLMPCNGLLYAPPHPCACYMGAQLNGFNALAPAAYKTPDTPRRIRQRLEKGPAYSKNTEPDTRDKKASSQDWPTYRCDAERSGYARTTLPAEIKPKWKTKLGGRLGAPTIAGGKLYVSQVDQHTVYALNVGSGKIEWSFVAGGRVDSPPTIWRDRLLFGSADGYVYCVNTSDGKLAWRFRVAPQFRRVMSYGQLESAWPIHGSVLVQDGVITCIAGRSMFLDGGLRLVRLDAAAGDLLSEELMGDRDPAGKPLQNHHLDKKRDIYLGLSMPAAEPDILSSNGTNIFMRTLVFDMKGKRLPYPNPSLTSDKGSHLFSPSGFLDDNWFHRSYWMIGRDYNSGCANYYTNGRNVPAGRILVFNDKRAYGYGRKPTYFRWTTQLEYRLFAMDKVPTIAKGAQLAPGEFGPKDPWPKNKKPHWRSAAPTSAAITHWSAEIPILVKAMTLAGKTLYVAGPADIIDEEKAFTNFASPKTRRKLAEQASILDGAQGAVLRSVSTVDGKTITELKLDALPVFDGMAAANSSLYLSMKDGTVRCWR
jgi:outer membrane protein assembly factor BamB